MIAQFCSEQSRLVLLSRFDERTPIRTLLLQSMHVVRFFCSFYQIHLPQSSLCWARSYLFDSGKVKRLTTAWLWIFVCRCDQKLSFRSLHSPFEKVHNQILSLKISALPVLCPASNSQDLLFQKKSQVFCGLSYCSGNLD